MTLPEPPASIWDRQRIWVTLGAVALIFLAAIEALAVTTVMPIVSEGLDGKDLYAVAFAGTLATSVIGMVAAGAWADARGPRGALYVAVTLFVAGLLISGLAVTMHQSWSGGSSRASGRADRPSRCTSSWRGCIRHTCTAASSPHSPRPGSCPR